MHTSDVCIEIAFPWRRVVTVGTLVRLLTGVNISDMLVQIITSHYLLTNRTLRVLRSH